MNRIETINAKKTMVFFDGYCNLCNSTVDWLISRDSKRHFNFASLQGKTAALKLSQNDIENLSTIVVLTHQGQLLRESKAVFYILRQAETRLKFLLIFSVLPTFMTDFAYRLVAANRVRLFGKRETCRQPTEEEKNYLLP